MGEGLERDWKACAVGANHLARFEKITRQLTGEVTPELPDDTGPSA